MPGCISRGRMMSCSMRWIGCSRRANDAPHIRRSPISRRAIARLCRSQLAGDPRCRNEYCQQAGFCWIEVATMTNLFELPLGPLERAFIASLQRLEPDTPETVLLAAALCCEALASGDVCLPLQRFAGQRPWPEVDLSLPPLATWRAPMEASPLIGTSEAYAAITPIGYR